MRYWPQKLDELNMPKHFQQQISIWCLQAQVRGGAVSNEKLLIEKLNINEKILQLSKVLMEKLTNVLKFWAIMFDIQCLHLMFHTIILFKDSLVEDQHFITELHCLWKLNSQVRRKVKCLWKMTQFLEIVDSSLGSLLHGSRSRHVEQAPTYDMTPNINILEGMCFHVPLFPISKWAVALLFL